jgi:competence protein ComEC
MPRAAWLAVGAAAAALAVGMVSPPAISVGGLAGVALAVSLRVAGRPRRWLPALAIGVLLLGLRAMAEGPPAPIGPLPSGDGPWAGEVESIGAPRDGSRPAILLLEIDHPVLVAATLPWYPPVNPGDRVRVAGRIRPSPADDYGAYLARIGAVGTLRAETVELLPGEASFATALVGLRLGAADALARAIPEPEAGLATGVLIGLRDRVDRDLAAAFTTAGASHVVAISGWNIAIVASTLAAVAGGIERRRRAALTVVAIVAYVAFVGPSASVIRAAVMAGVALLARELGRPGSAAAALGWACTALLLVDPAYIGDAGFRLSVLATAGILAWGSSLTARIAGPDPGRSRRWLAEILGVSLAAQVATTPIVLLDFGRLSLVAPAVNLVVVPMVPPAMALGAVALGAGVLAGVGAPAVLATLAGLPAWAVYAAMVSVVRMGAGMPLASLTLEPPWDVAAAGASAALVLAGARGGDAWLAAARGLWPSRPARRGGAVAGSRAAQTTRGRGGAASRSGRLAGLSLAGATVALGLSIAYQPDPSVRVTVLDVGQGDAILVEGEQGGRMVVDGGPDPYGLLQALDERLPPWDRRIDVMVLTHPHEDHVAGLPMVLARYRVGSVYESGLPGSGPGYRAWVAALAKGGPPLGHLVTGERLTLDSVHLTVIWPDARTVPDRPLDDGKAINNTSIVLLGVSRGQRFLLTGDAEEDVDPTLVGRGLPHVDLLKVAHHGSRTATTAAFLDATSPRVAVISVGAENDYGHPAPETLDRLRTRGVATYRTDLDGAVQVRLDGRSVEVRTERSDNHATSRPAAEGGGGREYHRGDAVPFLAARSRLWRRPARVLLGRRRLRARGSDRGAPQRRRTVSGWSAGPLATGGRTHRTRPPPRRDPRTPRHRFDVRRRQPGHPSRGRRADPEQRPA